MLWPYIQVYVVAIYTSVCLLQVTLVLKDRLRAIGVEVNIETFEEDQGIIGLGENPFVSYSQMLLLRKYCTYSQ